MSGVVIRRTLALSGVVIGRTQATAGVRLWRSVAAARVPARWTLLCTNSLIAFFVHEGAEFAVFVGQTGRVLGGRWQGGAVMGRLTGRLAHGHAALQARLCTHNGFVHSLANGPTVVVGTLVSKRRHARRDATPLDGFELLASVLWHAVENAEAAEE